MKHQLGSVVPMKIINTIGLIVLKCVISLNATEKEDDNIVTKTLVRNPNTSFLQAVEWCGTKTKKPVFDADFKTTGRCWCNGDNY